MADGWTAEVSGWDGIADQGCDVYWEANKHIPVIPARKNPIKFLAYNNYTFKLGIKIQNFLAKLK